MYIDAATLSRRDAVTCFISSPLKRLHTSICISLSLSIYVLYPHSQVIKLARGSEKADVYAYGVLLWELATREEVRV